MNEEKQKQQDQVKEQQQDPNFRKRTDEPGQNPKANDDPSHTVYNDENRSPQFRQFLKESSSFGDLELERNRNSFKSGVPGFLGLVTRHARRLSPWRAAGFSGCARKCAPSFLPFIEQFRRQTP